jgi:hypothetical protein
MPGQGTAEARRRDRAPRVGGDDLVRAAEGVGVLVDPGDEGADVAGQSGGVAGLPDAAAAGTVLAQGMQCLREQQSMLVQSLQHCDRMRSLLGDDPRVAALLSFGDLVSVLVTGTLEPSPLDQPEVGGRVVGDAVAFEVERFACPHPGQVRDDDEAGGAQQLGQLRGLAVADRRGAPGAAGDMSGDRGLEVGRVGDRQAAVVDEVAQLWDALQGAIASADQAGQVCPVDDEGAVAAAPSG